MLSDVDIVGGPGMTVEEDEAKLDQKKNNMEREAEGSWIFGAFERETKKSFFVTVQDRSGTSLMEVILRRIAPGTIIVSDLWCGVNQLLNQQQYQH